MDIKSIFPLFNKKSAEVVDTTTSFRISEYNGIFSPSVCDRNCLELYRSVAEVFFPIDYIARRVAGAEFIVKRESDDSIVWNNKDMNRLLSAPNAIQTWQEFVYSHFVYKLATGNSFIRSLVSSPSATKFKWSNHWWVLPSDCVTIENQSGNIPIFGTCTKEDLVKDYRLESGGQQVLIPTYQVFHDKDLFFRFNDVGYDYQFLKSGSRLSSVKDAVSNLVAVYSARNVIYVRRGALGFIVSQKKDDTGSVALTKKEKDTLLKSYNDNYGLGKNQFPYALSDQPISFIRTAMSIQDMQPFDETLADAIAIAGIYNIPSVLVPRKDQSTFSNQSVAEKSVYAGVIIPMCERFCKEFGDFIGLPESGLYLSADFSKVDCLQTGKKFEEQVKKLINDRCKDQFISGVITLNDWRAQIGESQKDIPLFSKLKFEMDEEELAIVQSIVGSSYTSTTIPDTKPDDTTEEDNEPTGNISNNAKV